LCKEISHLNAKIAAVQQTKACGMATAEQLTQMKSDIASKKIKEIGFKRLQRDAICSQRSRETRKRRLEQLQVQHPEVSQVFQDIVPRSKIGRPRMEENQPYLLKTIVDILSVNGAADPRRRTELLRSCMTIDQLQAELISQGTVNLSGFISYFITKQS
jgi:hypothetical protein